MDNSPLVSVIIIFYNSENYMTEAIESVFMQSYKNWELLLVDDGSTDNSSSIALKYSEQYPHKIEYLEHEEHVNLGLSASRNLGVKMAKGELIAFLDSDDIWMPEKLNDQVEIFNRYSDIAIVYGNALNWFSWSDKKEDIEKDNIRKFSLQDIYLNPLFQPPDLLKYLVSNHTASPYPSLIMVKKDVAQSVGGFNDEFRVTYDDQVFYAKVLLKYKAYVSANCWIKYRKHHDSITSETVASGKFLVYRLSYLLWLSDYLNENKFHDSELTNTINKRIEDTRNAILKKLHKTHNKIKRLEKSVEQKQKTIDKLRKTRTPIRIMVQNILVKIYNICSKTFKNLFFAIKRLAKTCRL